MNRIRTPAATVVYKRPPGGDAWLDGLRIGPAARGAGTPQTRSRARADAKAELRALRVGQLRDAERDATVVKPPTMLQRVLGRMSAAVGQ